MMNKPTKEMKQYYTKQIKQNKLFDPYEKDIKEFTSESELLFNNLKNKFNKNPSFPEYKKAVKRVIIYALEFKTKLLKK